MTSGQGAGEQGLDLTPVNVACFVLCGRFSRVAGPVLMAYGATQLRRYAGELQAIA